MSGFQGGRGGGRLGGRDSGRGGRGDSGGRSSGGGRDPGGRGGPSGGRGGPPSGGRGGPPSGGRGGPPSGGRGGGLSVRANPNTNTIPTTGRNRHMGEVASIQGLITSTGMSDRDILAVINPAAADRIRSNKLDATYSLESAYGEFSQMLPAHAAWRNTPTIGKTLNPATQIVRSNHFRLDPKGISSSVCNYAVHIYRYDREGKEDPTDCAGDEDSRLTTCLVMTFRDTHAEWRIGAGTGFTYNGRSTVYTSCLLPLPDKDKNGQPFISEIIIIKNLDGSESNKKYRITFTLVETIILPDPTVSGWRGVTEERILLALDTPLLSFARWGVVEDNPEWFLVGSKAFRSTGRSVPLSPAYNAMRGYYAGLKTCMAGLVLISDMSVSCFLAGGPMIDMLWHVAGYRTFDDMMQDASGRGIPKQRMDKMAEAVKGAKVKLTHLGHWRKVKSIGPAANSKESTFLLKDKKITVADYFVEMSKSTPLYKLALPLGRLRFPSLPCINMGSAAKPIYVPAELVVIPGGQCRSKVCTAEMTAKMITEAAVRPDERMKYIMDGSSGAAASDGSIVNLLRNDPTAKAFGLSNISKDPIAVSAILLPQAKLRYGGGAVVDPMLSGTWNMEGKKFINPPAGFGNIPYGILIVGGNHAPGEFEMGKTQDFQRNLEKDASLTGIKLTSLGGILACRNNRNDIQTNLSRMRAARIVVCVLMEDCYGDVKLVADLMGLVTQCAKFKKLERVPQGYTLNIMLKINTKLGGTNHTLISRLSRVPAGSAPVFQDPPASIAWIFDKPTMLVGIDVSHGETSSSQESVAAVVASMDGRAGQYAAHISVQTARQEMVSSLETAMTSLLSTFRTKNGGKMPSTIIVYRDGVGEGQFDQVTTTELSAIRGAVELMGFTPETVKISIVICQKGHHTRFVYEEMQAGEKTPTFINPCPGLCIDAAGGENSIASARLNEFYLNSHAAIQGTAKPCKYTLVHDEVGFKICELELLTYWLTYVYCRANKSVSYCSPAYYAHWASKRGKYLVAAGGTAADLLEISRVWGQGNMSSSMFFV